MVFEHANRRRDGASAPESLRRGDPIDVDRTSPKCAEDRHRPCEGRYRSGDHIFKCLCWCHSDLAPAPSSDADSIKGASEHIAAVAPEGSLKGATGPWRQVDESGDGASASCEHAVSSHSWEPDPALGRYVYVCDACGRRCSHSPATDGLR